MGIACERHGMAFPAYPWCSLDVCGMIVQTYAKVGLALVEMLTGHANRIDFLYRILLGFAVCPVVLSMSSRGVCGCDGKDFHLYSDVGIASEFHSARMDDISN